MYLHYQGSENGISGDFNKKIVLTLVVPITGGNNINFSFSHFFMMPEKV